MKKTWDNLEKYAVVGLRTLLLAKRKINEKEFNEWEKKYNVYYFFNFKNLFNY